MKLCVALAALHVIAKLLFIFIVVPSRAMSCHVVPQPERQVGLDQFVAMSR